MSELRFIIVNPKTDLQPPATAGRGLTLLDVAAFVAGAAVSALHMRSHAEAGLARGLSWFFWISFAGIAITATGPFLFPGRRLLRPSPGYPASPDLAWIALGIPWLLSAPLCLGGGSAVNPRDSVYGSTLSISLGIACVYVLGLQWTRWRRVNADSALTPQWPARIGAILAMTWPLQCAFALVALSV